jgi:hypothetical protein
MLCEITQIHATKYGIGDKLGTTMPRSKAQKLAKKTTRVRKRELALNQREQSAGVSPPPDYWIKDPAFLQLAHEAIARISLNSGAKKKS